MHTAQTITVAIRKTVILDMLRDGKPHMLGVSLSATERLLPANDRQMQQAFRELVDEGLLRETIITNNCTRYELAEKEE